MSRPSSETVERVRKLAEQEANKAPRKPPRPAVYTLAFIFKVAQAVTFCVLLGAAIAIIRVAIYRMEMLLNELF